MDKQSTQPAQWDSEAYWKSIQDENGVDLTLIRAALKMSPEDRMARSDAGRRQALYLRAHARRIDANASAPKGR